MKTIYSILFVSLILTCLLGCNGDGTNSKTDPITASASFKIINSDPSPKAELVTIDKAISVQFSEAIDSNSIQGNFYVFETVAGQTRDITSNGVISVTSSSSAINDTITFQPNELLYRNGSYQVSVLPGLASSSGDSLENSTTYSFSTETSDVIEIPGPPQITNWVVLSNAGCISVQIDFNEDLVAAPTIAYDLVDVFNVPVVTGDSLSSAMGSGRSFIYNFSPSDGCDPGYFSVGTKLRLSLTSADDLRGESICGKSPDDPRIKLTCEFSKVFNAGLFGY